MFPLGFAAASGGAHQKQLDEVGRAQLGLVDMTNSLRDQVLQLSTSDRMELVEEIWDSIAEECEGEPWPLNDSQREDLGRRVRELDERPERALPWDEARKRLWARARW